MPQRLSRRDPLLRIVDKDLTQQIQELAVEVVRLRDYLVKPFHAFNKFPRLPGRVWLRVVQTVATEEAGGAVFVITLGGSLHFFDEGFVD